MNAKPISSLEQKEQIRTYKEVKRQMSKTVSHYTAHKSPIIDRTIQRHMEIIKDEIIRTIKDIDSIVLSGGFGRGEGSVIRISNREYLPVNDYDIYVFSNKRIPESVYQNIIDRIHCRIRMNPDDFHVGIQFVRTHNLRNLSPDMSTVGLKSASRVIWGKDLRNDIPVEIDDIPLSVGLNTLFLDVLGLIENFEPEYLTQKIPKEKVKRFNYKCYKVYVSTCTALSLLAGLCDLYHAKRANIFSKYYGSRFPELSKVLPGLSQKVANYTMLKLKAVDFGKEKDPLYFWFDVRNELKYVLWYFLSNFLGEAFDIHSDFFYFLLRKEKEISSHYFEPYLMYAMRRRKIPIVPALLKVMMLTAHLALKINYIKDYYNVRRKVYLRPLMCRTPPLIRIYLASTFLLYSIEKGNQVDPRQLRGAHRLIQALYPCTYIEHDKWKTWLTIRAACIQSYKIISRREKITL